MAFHSVIRGIANTSKLRDVARLRLGICGQVSLPLTLWPTACRGEMIRWQTIGNNVWKNLTCTVQTLLDIGRRILPEAVVKLPVPLLRRSIRIVGKTAKDLEEVPITLEFIIVVAVL